MDLLTVDDLTKENLEYVLDSAAAFKSDRTLGRHVLAGSSVGIFFEHPSTRTRISSEVAIAELGGHPVTLRGEEVGVGSRETPEDVAKVLSRYVDLIAMRVASHDTLVAIREHATVPVVNLLSDRGHPCQVVADLQTIAEHRPIRKTKLAYVGDGNNVCQSLMLSGAMVGMDIRVATPVGHEPASDIREKSERLALDNQGSVMVVNSPELAVRGAHVVYTDVWTSMGEDREAGHTSEAFAGFQVDKAMLSQAEPDAMFLHCLPAHRGEEVAADVMNSARSLVYDQAENRLHAFKALLVFLIQGATV